MRVPRRDGINGTATIPVIWSPPRVQWRAAGAPEPRRLREGEILDLHIEDFDGANRTITIRHTLQYLVGKGLNLTEPKTEKGKRAVHLPDFVFEALVKHVDSLNRNQGFMFTTSSGTPFSPRYFYRDFEEQIEAAGLPKIRFHDLGHTAISFMMSQGIPPAVVQAIVGLSSPILTLGVYTHI
jgi:integrase